MIQLTIGNERAERSIFGSKCEQCITLRLHFDGSKIKENTLSTNLFLPSHCQYSLNSQPSQLSRSESNFLVLRRRPKEKLFTDNMQLAEDGFEGTQRGLNCILSLHFQEMSMERD